MPDRGEGLSETAVIGVPACWEFSRRIPDPVRVLAAPFPRAQIGVLHALAQDRSGAFAELLASNPGLAVALALAPRFVPALSPTVCAPWIAAHLPLRRRQIAIALGFPGAAVETLGRLPAQLCQPAVLLRLRRVFRRRPATLRALSHLQSREECGFAVAVLLASPDLWSPSLQADCLPLRKAMGGLLVQALRSLERHRRTGILAELGQPSRACRFPSLFARLHACQVRVAVDDWRRNAAAIAALPPPVPGNACILPLTTLDDILGEQREMQHCLLSGPYLRRLLTGRSYFYRVVSPLHRATVEVTRDFPHPDCPTCFLTEASGPPRARVLPAATMRAIHEWLRPFRRVEPTEPEPDLFALLEAARQPLVSPPSLAEVPLPPLPGPPPLPGSPDINPLSFPHEYVSEASETQTQAHLLLPLARRYGVYRVLPNVGVERATVVIDPYRTEYGTTRGHLLALWGYRGQPVSETTQHRISAWLREAESSPDWDDAIEPWEDPDDADPF